MKKLTVSVVFFSCCFMLSASIPVWAQSQLPYPPPFPNYYQQPYYSPYQPYIQPYESPSYFYPPSQPTYCWPGTTWSNSQQMYRCGLSLVYARRYYEAIQVFQEFLRYYPQSSLADNALYWTGECYYAQKQYHIALSYFQRILFEYPHGNKVPDAMLKIALSHMSLKQYGEGCRVLNDLIYRYPNSEPARKAYRWLGRCGGGYSSPYYGYDLPYYGYYGDATLPKNW